MADLAAAGPAEDMHPNNKWLTGMEEGARKEETGGGTKQDIPRPPPTFEQLVELRLGISLRRD